MTRTQRQPRLSPHNLTPCSEERSLTKIFNRRAVHVENAIKVEYTAVKSQIYSITCHEGPEKKMYRSTHSLTSAIDEGGWSTPRPGRFTPGKDSVLIVQVAAWAPSPSRTGGVQKVSPPSAFHSWNVQPVASRYTD